MNKQPLVSVIVGTKNASSYLYRSLKSIKDQSYKNIEIVLVDNFSTDNTLEIAKQFTDKIYTKGPERSSQYNFAATKAKGKYLYRIDSDFVVDKNVIKEAVEKCEKEGFDAIAIHNVSDPSVSYWSRVRELERNCYRDDNSIVAVRFFRKIAFDKVRGFDERMFAGEDYDLHNRIVSANYKWGRIKSKELHLGEVKSIVAFAKQCFRYGKNLVYYMNKYPQVGSRQMTPIRAAYIKHWRELVQHPGLTIGLVFMNIIKFGVGGFGGIVGILQKK